MFHLSAYQGSIANDGDLHQLTAISDRILPPSGLGLLSSSLPFIMAMAFVGPSLVRGEFQAPSLRDYGNPDVQPINIGTAFESPPRVDDLVMKPMPAAQTEEWDMFAAQDDAMDSETENGFLWSSDNIINPFGPKKIVQLHWTAAETLVSGVWSPINITLTQPLTSGTYYLIGARCLSAGLLAFRFVPSGSPVAQNWRPGGIGVQAEDQLDWPRQRMGGWGTWLSFTNTTIPSMELFSLSDDTSQEGIIDIVPY